jgi:hypothetical protein
MRSEVDLSLDMTAREWLALAARLGGTVLTAALVGWLLHCARRGHAEREGLSDVLRLEYALPLRWLFVCFVAGFLTFLGLTLLLNPTGMDEPSKLVEPVVLIVALCFLGGLETWLVRIELSDYGITSHSPWTGQRRLAWGEIAELQFDATWSWFVVRGQDGTKIYLNLLLKGLPSFAAAVRERLELGVYEQANAQLSD